MSRGATIWLSARVSSAQAMPHVQRVKKTPVSFDSEVSIIFVYAVCKIKMRRSHRMKRWRTFDHVAQNLFQVVRRK